MIPARYFDRRDTPTQNSPAGRIMRLLETIYPGTTAIELRETAQKRIHTGGPGQVKWSREEAKALKDALVLPGSDPGERLSSAGRALTRESLRNGPESESHMTHETGKETQQ